MVSEILTIIINAFTKFLEGVGNGALNLFNNLIWIELSREVGTDGILNTADDIVTNGLSNFTIWFLVFGAIGMAWVIFMSFFRLLKRR